MPDARASRAAQTTRSVECSTNAATAAYLRVGEIADATAARQSHQLHATDDIVAGNCELRLEVPRRIVHLPRNRAGAQHDAEGRFVFNPDIPDEALDG